MLKNYFKPDLIKNHLSDVSIEWIKSNNFDFIILDVDNTLVIKGTEFVDEKTDNWMKELINSCNTILICSNNTRSVAYRLSKRYSCYGFNLALKPFKIKVNQFLKRNRIQYQNACVIGDQLFTDIWLGKRLGMHTVLIQSNNRKDYGLTKLFRWIENKLLEQENVK
ncbi:MAG TPA: YqeG family HAD IIIA-type phosphatase [Erysipelotrichaceae bacterium]|jgi:hypothetical protein|nr:YqeG family HAD IIIA-type phosphatase [Erysipelotrichaceae bacterium]